MHTKTFMNLKNNVKGKKLIVKKSTVWFHLYKIQNQQS